jgi:uncharacterized membrane protein
MMMGFGFLGRLLFWGLLLVLETGAAWLLLQATRSRPPVWRRKPTVRQVLDARFAGGEISQEEYEAVRAQLEG